MGQVNVNERSSDTADRSTAAGLNLVAVMIAAAVLIGVLWFLFMGPARGSFGGSRTDINVNPPAPQQQAPPAPQQQAPDINIQPRAPDINVNPPAPQQAPTNR